MSKIFVRLRVFIAAVVLSASGGATCINTPVERLAVWSEFLPLDEIRPHMSALASRNADLYLAIAPQSLDDRLADFVADADAAGVTVRLWLQLPDNGVWLNEENANDFASFADATLDWLDATGAPVDWLIFDVEPSFSYAEQLAATLADEGLLGAFDLFEMRSDPDAFNAARAAIQQMVAAIHDRGRRAMAVSLPWVVNDPADGDDDLQDIFDSPLTGIDWDQVGIILYRSSLGELVGLPLSPAFVLEYSRAVRAAFGDRAQIAIGTISTPGLVTSAGYQLPLDISLDVMAARAAGIDDISVFSLDGMLLAGGPDPWLDAAAGATVNLPVYDPLAGLVPFLFDGLDALAD